MPTMADVERAREAFGDVVRRTPLLPSATTASTWRQLGIPMRACGGK